MKEIVRGEQSSKQGGVLQGAEQLLRLGIAGQAQQALTESVRLGLFTVLGGRALRVETIAEKLALQVAALQRLLRVLVVLGLIENRGTAYANTALARTYLCRRSRSYMGDFFIHCDTLQEQWLRVKPALKTGKMVQPEQQRIADYPRQLTLFLAAMDALGRLKNPLIQKHIPPRSVSAMLDLGGGLGTHAVSYARRNKNLNAIVFDLKDVVPQARRYIKAAGAAERVRALAGEALSDALPPGPFDLVLIANVLHIYGADDCRALIRKAAGVLAAKGILLVHDYFFGIGDQLAAGLFDMTMLSGTPEGRCYDVAELRTWMEEAGLGRIKTAEIMGGTSIIWGKKG